MQQKLVKPINLNNNKCYKNLPISTLNREFIPQSNDKNSSQLFLTPHSRFITNVGIELPCSDLFSSKYKTYTNNRVAYTQDGIQETIPPKKFSWADKPKMTFEYKTNQSFAIDKGIYDFNTINKFDDIQTFTGERESILSTITNNVRKDGSQKGGIVDGKINVEKAFPGFPWSAVKNQIVGTLEKFGTFCSIAIGVYTIINFLKNFCFCFCNCFLIRGISESLVNSLLLLINPSTYLLKVKKDSKKPQDDEEATPFKKQKEQERSSELYNLRKLNEQISLPGYSEKM